MEATSNENQRISPPLGSMYGISTDLFMVNVGEYTSPMILRVLG